MSKDIVKPSILPGFMELLPADQIVFNKMKDTIRHNYEKFGFIPLDTPTIEKSEILLAKGGGETEKQIYRFNKGNTDLSLRFDLTVPLARYVAQHFSDLTFPFRRYHISKVFRGEKNQKGRFREFYQCDIDIIGNGSLSIINDAEIPSIIYQTFKELGFEDFTIRINNRKVLNGFFEGTDVEDRKGVLRSIDKLEKIGESGVRKELQEL
ncbi:histidine--tRNA ligase, partial [Coprococcus sp. MSK.21.13]|nr:histidine--tRNA ligase [Coprococcus sp. MSK.21.13]